tara:strand:- start:1458 stop:1727 length:270 start_codon:yes stop_codon:yes gene_type:complete
MLSVAFFATIATNKEILINNATGGNRFFDELFSEIANKTKKLLPVAPKDKVSHLNRPKRQKNNQPPKYQQGYQRIDPPSLVVCDKRITI